MAGQQPKDISPVREESVFPSLDLETMLQDDPQDEQNSLHWRDIISVDTHHPSYNFVLQNTQSLSPGLPTEAQIDEWINYEGDRPISESQDSPGLPDSNSQKLLSREVISQHFYIPIEQAAEELQISSTRLKKRCRELGFKRWPNRKLRSLQTTINNVQELGQNSDGIVGASSKEAIRVLEKVQEKIEASPDLPLDSPVTRLRQSTYKALHTKRRKLAESTSSTSAPVVDQQTPLPEVIIVSDSETDEDEGNKGFKHISEFYP